MSLIVASPSSHSSTIKGNHNAITRECVRKVVMAGAEPDKMTEHVHVVES
jgi:hypothetical protein